MKKIKNLPESDFLKLFYGFFSLCFLIAAFFIQHSGRQQVEFPLGNLLDQSFAEISEGAAKKQYRALLVSTQQGMILCRACHRSRAAE